AVEAGARHAAVLQRSEAPGGPVPQLGQWAELDRVRRAGLGAGRFLAHLEPVVAQGALPDPPVVRALVDHPEGAGRHAVAAADADRRVGEEADPGLRRRAHRCAPRSRRPATTSQVAALTSWM